MPDRNISTISHKNILRMVIIVDVIAISIALITGNAPKHFAEAGFMTCFSFTQLLIIAAVAREIFIVRKGGAKAKVLKQPYVIWAVVAAAFVFLSIDEIATVHEHIDVFIHNIFMIRETALTDRIDDILVGGYGLLGLAGFYIYRVELKEYKKAFPLFIAGFIFMFIMVCLDILTNRDDIFRLFISDPSVLYYLDYWLKIAEDIFKIMAEGVFIGAFYYCLEIARGKSEERRKVI